VDKKINEIKKINNELLKRSNLSISELEETYKEFRKNVEVIKNILENVSIVTDENMYNSVVDDAQKILQGNERSNVLETLKKIYNGFLKRQKMSQFLSEQEGMLIYFNKCLKYEYNNRVDSKLFKENLKQCEEQLKDLKNIIYLD
jgi:hypothetical protein